MILLSMDIFKETFISLKYGLSLVFISWISGFTQIVLGRNPNRVKSKVKEVFGGI
jgi:hypothetical protein